MNNRSLINTLAKSTKKHVLNHIDHEKNKYKYETTFNVYLENFNFLEQTSEQFIEEYENDIIRLELNYYRHAPIFRSWPKYEIMAIRHFIDIIETIDRRFNG